MTEQDKKAIEILDSINKILEDKLRILKKANKELTKQLNLCGVSKCADEVIKYIENDAEIAMPVNELMHEDGRHLSKKEYGHVLLKYLIVELRERFC